MSHRQRDTIVIAGGGVAGAAAAFTLRDLGYTGRLSLVSEDHALPYRRRLLAAGYLRGEVDREGLLVAAGEAYGSAGIDVLLGARATSLDRGARTLTVRGHGIVPYHRLILATEAASSPRGEADRVFTLSSPAEVDALRAAALTARRAVVVGGGVTGTEAAASLRWLGLEVVLIEQASSLVTQLGVGLGRWLAGFHGRQGIEVRTRERVTAIEHGRTPIVRTAKQRSIEADLVVVATGSMQAARLAASAGLAVAAGRVLADARGATSDANIFVAGDAALVTAPELGRLSLPSDEFARQTARIAAAGALGLPPVPLGSPTLSSDQLGLRVEVVGFPSAGERSVQVESSIDGGWWAFVRNDRLVAISAVNRDASGLRSRWEWGGLRGLNP